MKSTANERSKLLAVFQGRSRKLPPKSRKLPTAPKAMEQRKIEEISGFLQFKEYIDQGISVETEVKREGRVGISTCMSAEVKKKK